MSAKPPGHPASTLPGRLLEGRWDKVTARSYGVSVHRVRCADGSTFYVKTTPPSHPMDARFRLGAEVERLDWLAGRGYPVPEVVATGECDELCWLVTTAMPGVPAAGRWELDRRPDILAAVAGVAASLHRTPVETCPFDRTLTVSIPQCRAAVERGTVDLDDLDAAHRGWSARRLLAEFDATPVPPEDDVVVCHGDLTLDNILVDPRTCAVTGILDVGRLGRADRWLDLAVVLRDLAEDKAELGLAPSAFLRQYGALLDDAARARRDGAKHRFYRLMDEFI